MSSSSSSESSSSRSSSSKSSISKKLRSTGSDPSRYHVIPQKRGWAVKREGTHKAVKVAKTKDSAIKYATGIALTSGSTGVTIHATDGTIIDRIQTSDIRKSKTTGIDRVKKKK